MELKAKYLFWIFIGFQNFLGPKKLRQLCPKQGTYFHLLSLALRGSPLPPPMRRRCLWMAPKDFFHSTSFQRLGRKSFKKLSSFLWRFEDTKICFWNSLIFKEAGFPMEWLTLSPDWVLQLEQLLLVILISTRWARESSIRYIKFQSQCIIQIYSNFYSQWFVKKPNKGKIANKILKNII